MKAFSVWNPKGGVGKTTITLHLAAYFASIGQRVLIVNLDPQQSSSIYADRSMVDVVDGMPKTQPDADIVIFDCPAQLELPTTAFAIMPVLLDPLSLPASLRSAKLAEGQGKKILTFANRVNGRRSEEQAALKKFSAEYIKDRAIYPRLIGRKKTVFDQTGLVDKLYGAIEAKKEMTAFAAVVTKFLGD